MEDFILSLIDSIKDTYKARNPIGQFVKRKDDAGYYTNYLTYVEWRKAISLHTTKGVKPDRILAEKHPNMTDAEFAYSIANFKQTTLPLFFDYIATVGRGVQDNNWSITYAEQNSKIEASGQTFKRYVEEDIALTPIGMSLESWFRYVLFTLRTNDSMGCIAIRPFNIPTTRLEDGTVVISGDTFIDPYPHYYKVDDLVAFLENEYYLFLTKEKSEVEYGGKKQRVGAVYEFYDKTAIYRVSQTGRYNDFKFVVETYYLHNLEACPVTRLKGMPAMVEDEPCYQSPYITIVDILDDALLDSVQLRSIKGATCYPQRVMAGDRCENRELIGTTFNSCTNGFILNEDGRAYHACASCGGTGIKVKLGVNNTILIEQKGDVLNPDSAVIKPSELIAFHGPSVDIPQFMSDEYQRLMLEARSIIHLKTTSSVVSGSADITATSMGLDERAKEAFIKNIIDGGFDIYEWVNSMIGMMRYGVEFEDPTIERPISYDFNTDSDYLNIISNAIKAGAPPAIVQAFTQRYIKAVFFNDLKSSAAYNLIMNTDKLLVLTQEDIQAKLPRNLIERWQVTLHDAAMSLITELVRKDPEFFAKPLQDQIDALIALAKESTPTVAGKLSVDTILGNANA
jgi:hypothetical protein